MGDRAAAMVVEPVVSTIGRTSRRVLKTPSWPDDHQMDDRDRGAGTFGRARMKIEPAAGTVTSLPVRPRRVVPPSEEAGNFGRVFELAEHRRRRMTGPDRIPEEVWEDISRAHELAGRFADHGRHVRFDTHRLTGRVVASLCDHEGNVVDDLGLEDIVGGGPDPVPAA